MSKIDILRQEVRRSEKVRRELESRLEESVAEVINERKLREKNEEMCHQVHKLIFYLQFVTLKYNYISSIRLKLKDRIHHILTILLKLMKILTKEQCKK